MWFLFLLIDGVINKNNGVMTRFSLSMWCDCVVNYCVWAAYKGKQEHLVLV